ncbi:MAG: hypothetical protein IK078_01580 [Lachnospiraceae bacterium]|nr:hypothetical protein [Lachnospiraceae bacterium]
MKKLIITYHGDVETTSFFMTQMEKQLQADGYQVYPLFYDAVPVDLPADIAAHLHGTAEQAETDLKGAVFLTFNFAGCYSKDPCLYLGEMLVDRFRMRIVNILVDHPYHYHDFLYEQIRERLDRYLQFDLDQQHVAYMKQYFPEISLGGFLPSGGTAYTKEMAKDSAFSEGKNVEPETSDDRPIDILFAGTFVPPEGFNLFIDRNGPEYSAFYHSMLREALADPSEKLEDIVRRRLIEEIEEGVTEEEIRQTLGHVQFLDYFVRYKRRGEVIRFLADWAPEEGTAVSQGDSGLHITIVGSGWEHLTDQLKHPERITLLPYADSAEVLALLAQTKLSLNVLPSFHEGTHDRIWNSMLAGAVCVTDTNGYMDAFLHDGENAVVFQTPAIDESEVEQYHYSLTLDGRKELEQLARRLYHLLQPGTKQELDGIAENGRQLALSQTWSQRTKELEKVLYGYMQK